ncbi:hypothetical protein [Paenibacillus tianmuensis]|uniref:hypothetical protein n=1 Tax=Paenibacillus tianmuensis TaxID=624147 RepID=UPI000B886B84|nr:hypothetical protein [Paenibacillus tianmuensis]
MEYAIEYLKKERETLLALIKAGERDKVDKKVEIEHAISWLQKLQELQFPDAQRCEFIRLPDTERGFFSYRIMNDCESEDRDDWIELKDDNGQPISLLFGDFLIEISSKGQKRS